MTMKLEKKVTKIIPSPKKTPAHTFAFPEVRKPEIGIGENHQLATVKQHKHRSLDLYQGEFRMGFQTANRGRLRHVTLHLQPPIRAIFTYRH